MKSRLQQILKTIPAPRIVACSSQGFANNMQDKLDIPGVFAFEIRLDLLLQRYEERIDEIFRSNIARLQDGYKILTVRSSKEGGQFTGSAEEKKALFEKYLSYVDMIDIEIDELDCFDELLAEANRRDIIVIGSYHEMKSMPEEEILLNKMRQGQDYGVDVVKIAVVTDSISDIMRLLRLQLWTEDIPLALMGMGRFSLLTRVFLAHIGSVWTYGAWGEPTAPNQPTCKEIYEWSTMLFGV